MAKLTESVLIGVPLADAWERYFDATLWPSWVDGFARTEASEGYPEVGGTLRWQSVAAGRGTVSERVVEHEPRRVHRVAFEDPDTEGELATTFAIEGDGARVTQELDYRLRSAGLFTRVADRLFIRSQQRGSLARSLDRFKHELEQPL